MNTTRLSSKGQVIIPKPIRSAHHWEPGLELIVIDTVEGVLLKQKNPFTETRLEDVAACLHYSGNPKSLEDMEKAIEQGVTEQTNGCN
jgi:AbrB family looped-hinge helix DNA binding protein